ncbi:hypothetical protein BDR22DRAFT_889338 [Usnea florida]
MSPSVRQHSKSYLMAAFIWGEYVRPTMTAIVTVGCTVRGGMRPSMAATRGTKETAITKELYTNEVAVKYYITTTGKAAERPGDGEVQAWPLHQIIAGATNELAHHST